MTANVNWFTEDLKEAWAYNGRLYMSKAKAMQEYSYTISRFKLYIQKLENGTMTSYGSKDKEEAIAKYVNAIERHPKPRKFKVVWDETNLA